MYLCLRTFQRSIPAVNPHVLMQPNDDCLEGHKLIDAILRHRIGTILASDGFACDWAIKIYLLQSDFQRLLNSSKKWMWPAQSKDRVKKIFEQTREERTANEYVPTIDFNNQCILSSIWSTFVEEYKSKPRLDVFVSISTKTSKNDGENVLITNSPTEFISAHSEHTWRQLMLGEKGPRKKAYEEAHSGTSSKTRSSSLSS